MLPALNDANSHQVRIFSPKAELQFAGHPTVGTACALVMGGHIGVGDNHRLIFEEGVGPVAADVEKRNDVFSGTLTLNRSVERNGETPSLGNLAAVLSLEPQDVMQVAFASIGLRFCFVHLASREAVDRAIIDKSAWSQHLAKAWSPNVFFFAGDASDGGELYARMSAPALGIEEDPATGSACAALVGALAANPEFLGERYWLRILQGVAMGRRSEIEASACKTNGAVVSVSVRGATTYVARGEMEVSQEFLS